jgi:GNAT superfamily N-acetyltransferase
MRHHRVMRFVLRRGLDSDAEATAELYLRARRAALPAIPVMVHTDEETRRWMAQWVVPETELWIAEAHDGAVVGMLVLDGDWVDQLYVEPELTGHKIGSELIAVAKRERPQGLRLWTFESNLAARRFYGRHGFDARERTAGDNEEGEPDILYVWDGQRS